MHSLVAGNAEVKKLVSSESLAKMELFIDLLERWNSVTNLTSGLSFQDIWQRHILDSICLQHVAPAKTSWLDFGSGSGFPSIVLGILLDKRRSAQIHCVEADGRKCAFLRTAAQQLKVPVKVHNIRAERIGPETTGTVEVVTARAFSSISTIVRLSESYLRTGAVLILPRGKTSAPEVEALDPTRYISSAHANPLAVGGIFLQIQLRAGRRQ